MIVYHSKDSVAGVIGHMMTSQEDLPVHDKAN
jgi:hypothetical protein